MSAAAEALPKLASRSWSTVYNVRLPHIPLHAIVSEAAHRLGGGMH